MDDTNRAPDISLSKLMDKSAPPRPGRRSPRILEQTAQVRLTLPYLNAARTSSGRLRPDDRHLQDNESTTHNRRTVVAEFSSMDRT